MDNGIIGETCSDFKSDDNELWCENVYIPDCADRTIRCSKPPSNPIMSEVKILYETDPNITDVYKTHIEYTCPQWQHYFDYPVENPFISFFYTNNIDKIEIVCNKDSLWDVYGGLDGLTCNDDSKQGGQGCKEVYIPACVERTVYCVFPPSTIEGGQVTVEHNPGPYSTTIQGQCKWTRWFNTNDNVIGKGDYELISEVNKKHGIMACPEPLNIIARVVDTQEIVSTLDGGLQNFTTYDNVTGFICRNIDQSDGQCLDYEISLCCPPGNLC